MMEEFPVLLVPLEVFDQKYLVEYFSTRPCFLQMTLNSTLMDLCLREGRALEFFSEELDLNESFALGAFASVFQTDIYYYS
jgi:hypothetical protein